MVPWTLAMSGGVFCLFFVLFLLSQLGKGTPGMRQVETRDAANILEGQVSPPPPTKNYPAQMSKCQG